MKENERHTAATFSFDAKSRFDAMFMTTPYLNGGGAYQIKGDLESLAQG